MSFLRKSYWKIHFWLDEAIKRCVWASYALDDRTSGSDNPRIRTLGSRVAAYMGNMADLIATFPRLEAVRITHRERVLIYVGRADIYKQYLLNALFPQGYEETPLGRVAMWQLNRFNQQWLREGALVVCRVSRAFPWRLQAAYRFTNPINIEQVLDLQGVTLEGIIAGGYKKKLRRAVRAMQNMNFTVRISHDPQDLHFFYHQMHKPLMQQRHGDLSNVLPYDVFERKMQHGGLMFLLLDGEIVIGDFFYTQHDTLYDYVWGIRQDPALQTEVTDHGIASYWHIVQYALEQGAKRVSFITSNAWTSDGVFYYKRQWDAHVAPDRYFHDQFVFLADHLSPEWAAVINETGFITRQDDTFLQVYAGDFEEREARLNKAQRDGLSGILEVTSNGQAIMYSNSAESVS